MRDLINLALSPLDRVLAVPGYVAIIVLRRVIGYDEP